MEYLLVPLAEAHRRPVIDIFNHYVSHSFAAFPEEPVGYGFFDRLREMARGYPALAAVDQDGQVAGFGFLRAYHPASSFRRTAELTYFIGPAHCRRGLGSLLLERLLAGAAALSIDSLLAAVSSRNEASLAFHLKHGFVECGRFNRVGRKLGADFDVVWLQRQLG